MDEIVPARYTCYRAGGNITVDGRLDEADWLAAPKSGAFVDIVSGEAAWFDTRVALLWDDECLYFGFWAEEPRVWATLTDRDSKIYEDNDLEVFVAGPEGQRSVYYEFEVNALNTVYEAFWVWKDSALPAGLDPERERVLVLDGVGGHVHPRGERWGFLDWDLAGLRSAVHVGERGWTAEIAMPWSGSRAVAGWGSSPPREGDVWRIDCSRFQQFDREGRRIPPGAGWTWNRHGHYDSHIPEVFPYVLFSGEGVRGPR